MFGIGTTEFIVIAIVLLIFAGPKQLPGLLHKAAEIIKQLQNTSRDLRNQIDEELKDISKTKSEIDKELIENANRIYGAIEEADDELRDLKDDLKSTKNEINGELEKDDGKD
ncbi:MAG: twin-arginine translocase TatA/TatE family subunit [Deltaproteobacteria bacterium]|nr:twin-arginine translocase TatA/TatE family subunit [Deltaproteobacteria bacterium]